ncbi:hypothetical protein CVO77_06090 [Sphingopyxis lindanitolerans]|uniref:Uncharacterized protein n=1 Tax=Sphingopyxis lindanitolerans TaxID=2054227 RepID=A0A2S8B6Q2_9SPHN|nr:hypothetical protein [Sphingopyxis lindanitolerans]PQM28085.1 hypothetical protein CVO77_06090 [Sphingopyxis lindanitolerans]
MMISATGPRPGRDAASLRFLALCLGGWVLLRAAMLWSPALPPPPAGVRPSWDIPSRFILPVPRNPADARLSSAAPLRPEPIAARRAIPSLSANAPSIPNVAGGDVFGGDRHGLRLALIARLLPAAAANGALRGSPPPWLAANPRAAADPGRGEPFWMQRSLAGWSLGGWLYLRAGSADGAKAIAAGGQLGGSQAGIRLAYGFGDDGRLRAYGRATMAARRPAQRELAFGAAFAPVPHLPVDVAIEQRVAIGSEGRTALAAMVTGGVGDIPLPAGFRLDAYAQAGIVGTRRRDGFADGAVIIDRRLGGDKRSPLRLGALAAGAVQPGAARIDIGPRLTVRLPAVGKGSRIALDWRQRIAGDARPASGVALTLATDF